MIVIYAAEPDYIAVRNFIARETPVISVICKVEVLGYHKLEPMKKHQLEELFQLFPVLPLSESIIDKAIS